MNNLNLLGGACIAALILFTACNPQNEQEKDENTTMDVHSFARPGTAVVKHLDLNIAVNFGNRIISGTAAWEIETPGKDAAEIIFDTQGLEIEKVSYGDGSPAEFALGNEEPYLGRPLTVQLKKNTKKVVIQYVTSPQAAALQWLDAQQTAGKEYPYLFTQSQAILARSWIPCQDSPGIRFTYNANVQVPAELLALMSAENPTEKSPDGSYSFRQSNPIPSYLMALAVGDISFQSLGRNTGVYAEPSTIADCASELSGMQAMMDATEALYGTYRWNRYDVIVLPPSFPFGGMENPELTFATPTIIAGDRSLVSLIAHELAHSWSGNLVTNATWDDFWLNEGFTVYIERRIMESLEGRPYADMLALIGFQDLQSTIERLGVSSPDTRLKLELKGRNPDDGVSDIAYEKGFSLLRKIEEVVGRDRFDAFLKGYFNNHAFGSITTEEFLDYYQKELIGGDSALAGQINIKQWIYEPGLPGNHPEFRSERFEAVDKALADWTGGAAAMSLETSAWSTHEWLHFIRQLPADIDTGRMEELDQAFDFTGSGNSELLAAWFLHAIQHRYEPAYPALERFLVRVGRRKFLTPLYTALAETEEGRKMAEEIYSKARPNYHYVSRQTIDELLR